MLFIKDIITLLLQLYLVINIKIILI